MLRGLSSISTLVACAALLSSCASGQAALQQPARPPAAETATPIRHLVVIFDENVSFDHYFATYPMAANPAGEPVFTAQPGTPGLPGQDRINTLTAGNLLTQNPNATNAQNGADAALPFRLDRSQAATADQNHAYGAEQSAFDGGAMDLFPRFTGRGGRGGAGAFATKGQVMGYYDGNTVTALWNYAQHFAMSDNAFGSTTGPSTPGAINLISGQTNGVIPQPGAPLDANGAFAGGNVVPDGAGGLTMIGDLDPTGDVCSNGKTAMMSGRNIGDLLNAQNVSWGFFQGGFDLTAVNPDGSTGCKRSTMSDVTKMRSADYSPHHQPFQYYASTANPQHLRPASVAVIGKSGDGANHQYDLTDFYAALHADNLPAVSFLKAPSYQDGHAGYSDPLDEQTFVVTAINALQASPDWASTAVIILYDDSDGWYDHVFHMANPSALPIAGFDNLNGQTCGAGTPLPGVNGVPVQGRCGFGSRQPLLVISPYARANHVDHTLSDQSSVIHFIEDNWLKGSRIGQGSFDALSGSLDSMFDWAGGQNAKLMLDPETGQPAPSLAP